MSGESVQMGRVPDTTQPEVVRLGGRWMRLHGGSADGALILVAEPLPRFLGICGSNYLLGTDPETGLRVYSWAPAG